MNFFRPLLCLGLLIAGAAFAQTPAPDESPRLMLSLDHNQRIKGLRLSPDESLLFTWDEKQVRTWHMAAGKALATIATITETGFGKQVIEDVRVAKRRDQVLISDRSRLFALDLRTFDQRHPKVTTILSGIPIHRFVYDEKRDRIYAAVYGGSQGFRLCEPDFEKQQAETGVRIDVRDESGNPSQVITPRQLELRADGRLFVSLWQGGFVIVDPETWRITHRHASEEDATKRGYFAGPDNTVVTTWREGAFARVQVLGGDDFGVLRETRVVVGAAAGALELAEAGGYDAKTGRIVFTIWRHAPVALDFSTLKPLVAPRPSASPVEVAAGDAVLHASSRDEWLVADGDRVVGYDPARQRIARRFSVETAPVERLVASPVGREWLVVDGESGGVKRVRLHAVGVEVTEGREKKSGNDSGVAYSPDGTRIAAASPAAPRIVVGSRERFPAATRELPSGGAPRFGARDVFFSPDGKLIAAHGLYVVSVFDQEGAVVFQKDFGKFVSAPYHELGAFSPDGRTLIVATPGPALTAYDMASGKELWTQKTHRGRNHIHYVGEDVFGCFGNRQFEYRSSTDGQLLFTTEFNTIGSAADIRASAVSPDRKLLAVYDGRWVHALDTETGEERFKTIVPRPVTALTFLADNRTLVGAGEDQLQRIWDVAEKKELATLALFKGNTDWVLSAPDLRFDGAESALGQLYLVKSGTVLPLESLFEKLHTPRLAATLFDPATPAPEPVDIAALAPAPLARIELADGLRNLTVEDDDVETKTAATPRVRLRVSAQARQSQVSEIRLYQNGKLMQTTTRNLTVEDDEPLEGQSVKTFELELAPGENLFRAVAINAQRTESAPADLAVVYAAPETTPADPSAVATSSGGGLRLHVLIVGINAYKNPRHRLNYAVADATAVAGRLRERAAGIFTDVRVTSLIDTQADKAGITGALRAIAAEARARDVFVFYYAGHGVMAGEGGAVGDFFLVPYDVTQLYGADEQLTAKAVSSKELLEFSKAIPAQKQLFLLDACQSAGALQAVAMRGAAEEKAIAQLARSSGTHWITASGSEQFATEFEQLGHGAFTFTLLDGLLGKGDNGDGRVTVNELKAWLESQVPEVTQKYKGAPQYPASYGYGQDFPVGLVAK